ncbi:MAG: hypothetical protein JXA74_10320, partial [Anaerolineae bacterium]|nr:hypothetical protein [Anaerolineae bacterium]
MLIALRNQVYACRSPAEAPALCWEHAGVRRVAEGISQHVVALDTGELALLAGDSTELIATGLHEPIESLLILNDNPLDLLIGTEAPQLYRYRRGSTEVAQNRSFAQLDCRDSWHTPWGGPAALRSMASTADGWVYADIHVGSIMRSPDRGQNWEPVTPTLHEDVHQVATTPACNERVYANTYKAVYVSDDRGRSWSHRAAGLGERYGRAM